jgi:hypothetical protein
LRPLQKRPDQISYREIPKRLNLLILTIQPYGQPVL